MVSAAIADNYLTMNQCVDWQEGHIESKSGRMAIITLTNDRATCLTKTHKKMPELKSTNAQIVGDGTLNRLISGIALILFQFRLDTDSIGVHKSTHKHTRYLINLMSIDRILDYHSITDRPNTINYIVKSKCFLFRQITPLFYSAYTI